MYLIKHNSDFKQLTHHFIMLVTLQSWLTDQDIAASYMSMVLITEYLIENGDQLVT